MRAIEARQDGLVASGRADDQSKLIELLRGRPRRHVPDAQRAARAVLDDRVAAAWSRVRRINAMAAELGDAHALALTFTASLPASAALKSTCSRPT